MLGVDRPELQLPPRLGQARDSLLSVLAANSIVWRSFPDWFGRRVAALFEWILDSLLGTLLAATVTITLAHVRLFGLGFEFLLYLSLVYRLLSRFLPDEAPAKHVVGPEQSGFRLAGSLLVLAVGFPLSTVLPGMFSPSPAAIIADMTGVQYGATAGGPALAGLFLGTAGVAWGGTALYVYATWWRTAANEDRVDFFEQLVPRELDASDRADAHRDLARGGPLGAVSNAIGVIGSTGILAAVFVFFGLLSGMAVVLFPLPELVVLGGAAAAALAERLPASVDGPLSAIARRRVDIEERFFEILRYVRASRKGIVVVPYVVLGVLLSMFFTLVSNAGVVIMGYAVATQLGILWTTALRYPLLLWNALGAILCLLVPGFYALWFWVRQVARLPHYLDHWEGTHPGSAPIESMGDLPASPTRPPWYLLPPSLLFLPAVALSTLPSGERPSLVLTAVLAVAWPGLLGVVAWTVRWTGRADPQPARTDGRSIPAAFLVQLAWLWLLVGGWLVDVGTTIDIPTLGLIVVLSTLLYLTPELQLLLQHASGLESDVPVLGDPGEHSTTVGGLVLGSSLLVLAGGWLALGAGDEPLLAWLLALGGALLLGLGAAAGITSRLRERTEDPENGP